MESGTYAYDTLSLAYFGMSFKNKYRTLESNKRLLKASIILVSCILFNFLAEKAFVKITQGGTEFMEFIWN